MKLSELQRKDIINLRNGKKVGRIIDVEINTIDGTLMSLVIEKRYFKSLFSSDSDVLIKFNQIKKMGEDVILIDMN